MSHPSQVVKQFVDYLRFERHFSPYTARCYEADLRQYIEFLVSSNGQAGGEAISNGAIDGRITAA
ncbi:MAG: site-specific integrase, partial [Anaerolineae bacterium]|nr:site-specific integrase [Anaerolineae bacterium]